MTTRGMMAVREIPINKLAGGVVWVIGTSTTWIFLQSVNPGWGWNWLAALVAQLVLTAMQSTVWRGQFDVLGVTALVADSLLNAGGVFVFVQRFDETAAWYALSTGFSLNGELSNLASVILSIAIGIGLAGAPEYLWKRGGRLD